MIVAAALAMALAGPGTARAEAMWGEHGTDYVTLQAGAFNIFKTNTEAAFGAEYRSGAHLWLVHPFAGIFATHKGAVYGYGGFLVDVPVGDRLYVTPSLAVGGYHQGNGNRDLGSVIEFRSALEISYRFDNGGRLGARIEHISNAGISNTNPGSEQAFLTYSHPIGNPFGR